MAANRAHLGSRLLGVGMPIMIVCILALQEFGSAAATVAWLRGDALFLESPAVVVGQLIAGSPRRVQFPIRNLSSEPFSVIGARTDCGCAVAGGVPVRIQPGKVAYLSIRVTPRQQDAGMDFQRTLTIFVDLQKDPISIPIRGHVAAGGLSCSGADRFNEQIQTKACRIFEDAKLRV